MMVWNRVVTAGRSSSPASSPLVAQHLALPLLVQYGQVMGLLVQPHPPGDVHALAEQLHQLPVDLVDLPSQALQVFHHR